MKYVPCSSSQCDVKVIDQSDQSDQCVSCNTTVSPFSNRLRALQTSAGYQSSVVTFEIDSTTPLDEDVVTSNLNSNITIANKDLAAITPPLELKTNFTASTRMPTSRPTINPKSGKATNPPQPQAPKSGKASTPQPKEPKDPKSEKQPKEPKDPKPKEPKDPKTDKKN
jgi:hypothetical protein